ncbi:hypothetical protein CVS40_5362 [Lucilia cuprina]|nr:hypothetical protein CVS40_5362 [Lucilia cuprina]
MRKFKRNMFVAYVVKYRGHAKGSKLLAHKKNVQQRKKNVTQTFRIPVRLYQCPHCLRFKVSSIYCSAFIMRIESTFLLEWARGGRKNRF